MATISSKLMVQLPALLFSVLVIVMSRQAWSNDHITTYKLTSKNGEASRVVITERIRNGVHLYLSRTQSEAEAGETTDQDITGVMGLIPDPNNSGSHRMFDLPSSPERVTDNFSSFRFFRGAEKVVMPSYDELSKLLLPSPDVVKRFICFALPLPPLRIPAQSEGASQVMELQGYIRYRVVEASADNATFTVRGYVRGLTGGARNTGISYSPITTEDIPATAIFTRNPGGERVQLERIEIEGYSTVERELSRESGERDDVFEDHWDRFEIHQQGIAKELRLLARISAFLDTLSQSEREFFFSHDEQLVERFRAFEALEDNANDVHAVPENSTAGGEPEATNAAPVLPRESFSIPPIDVSISKTH